MKAIGVIEHDRPRGRDRFRLLFSVGGERIRVSGWPNPDPSGRPIAFKSREAAQDALNAIRADMMNGRTLWQALSQWVPHADPEDLLENRVEEWLSDLEKLEAQEKRSSNTLREYRRYAKAGGYFSPLYGQSIRKITNKDIRQWQRWLGEQVNARSGKRLSPKTQKNVSDALRACFRFHLHDETIDRIPHFAVVDVPEYQPQTVSIEEQVAIISHIPWERRGAFLAAATESLRLSEVRAMDLDDYRDGRLRVWRAIQGPRASSRRVERTKNRTAGWRELWHEDLLEWIEWRLEQATPEARLRGEVALFWCPEARNRAKRWTPDPLERQWRQACEDAEVAFISFQQGTRHSTLTALGSVLPERILRAYSRHKDGRSLDRYVKPGPKATRDAVVKALPRRQPED